MRRITFLEERGASVALMTGTEDGDCARSAADAAPKVRVLASCGLTADQLSIPPQVHGKRVLRVSKSDSVLPEADGLLTTDPGVALGITVADCVPVYLLQRELGVAALLHAGREGTMQNICGEALAMIRAEWGALAVAGVYAYIGASAGPCCYEVSADIADEFDGLGLPRCGRNLDLWGANRLQLERGGVPSENIVCAEHCTMCMGGYFSYRGMKTAARNLALLKL